MFGSSQQNASLLHAHVLILGHPVIPLPPQNALLLSSTYRRFFTSPVLTVPPSTFPLSCARRCRRADIKSLLVVIDEAGRITMLCMVRYNGRYWNFEYPSLLRDQGETLVDTIPTEPEAYRTWLNAMRSRFFKWDAVLQDLLCIPPAHLATIG